MRTVAIVFILAATLVAQKATTHKVTGPAMAKVSIEVFSDYQCPGCKELYEKTVKPLLAEYGTRIRFTHREFPLPIHAYAREAACFACAADKIGKYEQVCEALFRDQDSWSKTGRVAESACSAVSPAEAKRLRELAQDSSVKNEIESDLRLGAQRGLTGTPTLFISNGGNTYRYGIVSYPILRRAVENFLAH
jgi:protein-disulfide isomerase